MAGCTSGGGPEPSAAGSGTVRTYYVAAEQVVWDYAPDGRDVAAGTPFGAAAEVFVAPGPDRVGSRYVKCVYRGYADASFRTPSAREGYLGLLGPVLHAEVGDTVEVVFRNRCSFPTSVHPHGVRYAKSSEGAPYGDGTTGADRADDAVPTGGSHTYRWEVPERSGPGAMEGSSVAWMYHSHSDEIADVNAGLSGFLVVTARGRARPDGSPKDVDREVFSLFEVMDENASPLLTANVARLRHRPSLEDEDFQESNLMHAVNGYVFGNGPRLTLRLGEHVRWYVMGMGNEVDLHTPHWHGTTAEVMGMRTDVVQLLPAGMHTADLQPDKAGTWLFHCHVNDHLAAGMQALYDVQPA
jgi:FtsP/CotA-like multicopper oxidase with cupredoxin domain